MSASVERRRFTVAEFARLAGTGCLRPDERLELVDGEVVQMSPIGERHAACVDFLTQRLSGVAAGRAIVRVQGPLAIPTDSELYPDVALLRPRDDFYRSHKPAGEDTLLVVEVSDTTLAYDRDVKAPICGKGGVPEFWLVDLGGRRVEIYCEPSASGYRLRRTVLPGETVVFEAIPGLAVAVADLVA
jgi:Uma2 family endonuclease